ncbi:hypothetical protein ACQ27_gp414 [Klebsiella phage K64-1]|uniref:hypothetical protein n=1 Tax=Klebsiella phage K64-1 TaxID=1439894 RepID=UPI00248B4651|nr:hypothetical protein ACQ27_gp414 [Klebsiella phage K64-1]
MDRLTERKLFNNMIIFIKHFSYSVLFGMYSLCQYYIITSSTFSVLFIIIFFCKDL